MKNDLVAIYNTLKTLKMPPTPENTKHMAGVYVKLEELISVEVERERKAKEKNVEKDGTQEVLIP